MNEQVNRVSYIDFFKSIGILLMIMGHIGFGNTFDIYIHAFHMPMFFFISGYLFHNYDFKKFITKKFKTLILPYFEYGFVNLLACLLLLQNFKIGKYFERFLFFNNKGLQLTGALWFLTALFFGLLIFWTLLKYVPRKFRALTIVGIVFIEWSLKIRLPFSIDSAIFMLPIIYTGFLLKTYEPNFSKYQKFGLSLMLFIVSFPLIMHNGMVNARQNVYSNLILFYTNAIVVSYACFLFTKAFSECSNRCLSFIGKHSLEFMCLNQILILILGRYCCSNNFLELIATISVLSIIVIAIDRVKAYKHPQALIAVDRE